ncbi:MAG: OsmC family peroxiredoxin [Spirochaetes bacterium]|nr:MAG: OsmC family peroxiredoxin [Spirochaetota bacterium]
MRVTTFWMEDLAFDSEVNGHHIVLDADDSVGGKDRGPRPKNLVLASLTGCTGMDVISILNKMRVKVDSFRVIADGEAATEHPKVFNKIHLIYEFKGKDLPMDKLKKAVELSQNRYCPVSAMLKNVLDLSYEIKVI